MNAKLVNKNGIEVKKGEKVVCFRGEEYTLVGFRAPKHAASTGRVIVKTDKSEWNSEYFPSVFDLKIVGHEFE